ncbi:Uncharacterised protein [Mycolicibacterium phlei]|jgi:PBP1b-binding outer membrane lipoprotein LpoB|uniref:hypothetical protein n=1 Tax=Mycolicibacterium phlei TaxID=1771 RepID=UPI00077705C1|nr:hypothetical protein [Mycolicibacterium phlei]AMO63761.1 hypothetical protein MPHLCCUG_04976 [Mycolicibacterium phlei]KXW76375.1 hypothetical protein JL15_17390 [Mycolicibacterium phlei DSM 43071]STZ22217.1 Uncharacterised protein [Mycolicibacterium phlei]VEG11853.1 Uncharacterised protein [Mycobacteroides chelonae]
MNAQLGRRIALLAGGTAALSMVLITASCSNEEKAPETSTETSTETTTTTTTAAEVEPTEKAPRIDPGPNPFSPTVFAPPAPTAIPGDN